MALSNDLISQFAKLTAKSENTKTEATVYGTAKIENDTVFVKIDGSDRLTPVQTAVDVKDGERVIVSVKDHSATITGNTSPSGIAARVETVSDQGKKIDEFDIIVSYKVTTDDLSAINATIENLKAVSAKYEDMTAITAQIETLQAKYANLKYVNAEEVTAILAEIERIHAMFGEFTSLSTEDLEAANAEIGNLQAHTANFTYVSTELLKAYKASIEQLDVEKLNANFANINYTDITKANIKQFYADSGLINTVKANGIDTTYLVGVTIKGDQIEANTIVADQLVIKGEDGLYYKLNASVYDRIYYQVIYDETNNSYETTSNTLENVNGTVVEDVLTTDGYPVYSFINDDNTEIFYTINLFYKGEKVNVDQIPREELDGKVIAAKSITAEKMSVSDLAAFKATIGNFNIVPNKSEYFKIEEKISPTEVVRVSETYTTTGEEVYSYVDSEGVPKYCCMVDSEYYKVSVEETQTGAIYSGVKDSIDNTTRGLYLGSDGQIALGDETNYLKYHKDEKGNYKFALSAESIFFGSGKDFTLDDRGITVEGTTDDSNTNNNIKTVVSNNGMSVHVNNQEEATLSANDKGVVAKDLHAKTYLIVGSNSRLENYDVASEVVDFFDFGLDEAANADISYLIAYPGGDNKTYTFSAMVTILDPPVTEVMIRVSTDENISKCNIQPNGKLEFTYKNKFENDSPMIMINFPPDFTFSSGIMWNGQLASPVFEVPKETTYALRGYDGYIHIVSSDWSGSTEPEYYLSGKEQIVTLPAGSYRLLHLTQDGDITMTNINKIKLENVKITERISRTGCFWIGE